MNTIYYLPLIDRDKCVEKALEIVRCSLLKQAFRAVWFKAVTYL